jgi:hypothetical protein
VIRLGWDFGGALSNWPWKADFWKGLERSVIDVLEIGGLAEAWEIAAEIIKPWQRAMTSEEIAVARNAQEPLTIVVPDFDYSRTLEFAVDLRRKGSHLTSMQRPSTRIS